MDKRRVLLVFLAAAAFLAGSPRPSSAQLIIGQYEEEAPFGTWNTFPFVAAAALGRGETAFTLAGDGSAGQVNPALLPFLPKFTLAINGYLHVAAFNKFGPVNTGVLGTDGNANGVLLGLDAASLGFRLGGWTVGLSVTSPELYDRPQTKYELSTAQGVVLESATFIQTGLLREFNIAVGRRLGPHWSVGIGLSILAGRLEREWLERWQADGGTYEIADRKTRDFHGTAVQAGLIYEIPNELRIAAVFRSPFLRTAKSRSELGYSSPSGTRISIPDSATDEFREPLAGGLGVSWLIRPELTVAADVTWIGWSKYRAEFFGDPDARDFKDVVKLGIGGEYLAGFDLFGAPASMPVRIGLVYDPQPMKNPSSAYLGFTFGTGVRWKRFLLDAGALIGSESGSGADLGVKKFGLSLGFVL